MNSVLIPKVGQIQFGQKAQSLTEQKLQPKQVLVKVEAAPLNPSDILFMRGLYPFKLETPFTPGWEGSGTVIAAGNDELSQSLIGKRVAFMKQNEILVLKTGGAMAEYCITTNRSCMPLADNIGFDEGSALFVNPLTAICMVNRCKQLKSKATIVTAAASQIGKMIIHLLLKEGIVPICTVRKADQAEMVKQLVGPKYADFVINTSDKDWMKKLGQVCLDQKPTTCLEAVAGPMTGLMLQFLGFKSTLILYGLLSDKPASGINAIDFMGRSQTIESFLLTTALGVLSKEELAKVFATANSLYDSTLKTNVNATYGLHQFEEAIDFYLKNQTAGKVILKPSLTPAGTAATQPINLNDKVKGILAKM